MLGVVAALSLALAGALLSRRADRKQQETAASSGGLPHDVVDVRVSPVPLTAEQAQAYLGDAACAECHADAARQHARSRHARTLRPVEVAVEGAYFARGREVWDERAARTYEAAMEGGRPVIHARGPEGNAQASADYAIGTGRNAVSFFSIEEPGQWTKLRISYFHRAGKWEITPSRLERAGPLGVEQSRLGLDACLRCHVTFTVQGRRQALQVEQSRFSVGCERCHGPGRPHVEAVRATGRDPVMERLGRARPDRITSLCGDCHRTSGSTPLNREFTTAHLPRFHGTALEQSPCYRRGRRLSCVSCHNPHQDASPTPAHYDATCRSCHTGGKPAGTVTVRGKRCPVNPNSGCTGCHMPKQQIGDVPHSRFTNHWIKVYRGGSRAARPAVEVPPGESVW